MNVPPKGDPQRPIELAIRSALLLGIASTVFGLVMVFGFGYFNRLVRFRKYFIGLGMLVWFVPGVLFLTEWWFMRRRSRPAVITAMVTAAVQALFAACILGATLKLPPVSPIPVILTALWAVALGQLLVHLWRSLESVRLDTEHLHGFDTIAAHAPLRVLPVEVNSSSTTADPAAKAPAQAPDIGART